MNIATLLQSQASTRPDACAIIDRYRGRDRRNTFADLESDAARGAALLHEHGIGKGDRVLVFQPMSYELYVALLAIFRLGAVAMFVDPSAGRVHIEQCCDIAEPHALIASARAHLLRLVSVALRRIPTKFVVGRYAPGAISMRRARFLPLCEPIAACEPEDPALLTFTSGSTGRPKAALRSQGFLIAQHWALSRALRLQAGEVDLTTLPVFLLANLAAGLTSVIPNADLRFPGRIKAAAVIEQVERLGITRSAGSPAFYQRLVEYCAAEGKALAGISRLDTGGAPVLPSLLDRMHRTAPTAKVVAVYGSTEAEPMAHVAWSEMGEDDLVRMQSGHGLLAGLPVPEVTVRVLQDHFGVQIGPYMLGEFQAQSLPAGEVGEIVVTGEHVLKGYLHGVGDKETKFEVGGERWHRTGDAGYFDASGRLWLVGRCSARIKDAKGILYPFTVECAAQFIAGLLRSAMVGHEGRRILLVEAGESFCSTSLLTTLAWVELDEVRVVKQIPVDKRHNAKVDYTRVHELLS
ncbi:MAG: AMP-binding protein [Pseudomonadota bacterium]